MSRFLSFSSVFLPMALLAVLGGCGRSRPSPLRVSVRRDANRVYQVMIGNYAEDPGFLLSPDIVTIIPTNGEVKASLMPNPQGLSEMVRITVIAADLVGNWLGATTLSKLVPGSQRQHMPRKTA